MSALERFIAHVWEAIWLALGFNAEAARFVSTDPESIAVVLTVAFLAGLSLLLGQSVVLFLNRVSKARFAITLVLNAVIYVINLAIWSVVIWFVATFAFGADRPIGIGALAILLGSAPFVFGFFILIPYVGIILTRILYAWSFLITLVMVQAVFAIGWLQALVCVGLGWVLLLILNRTVGRPIVAVRDRIFHRLTGLRPYGPSNAPESEGRPTRRIGMRSEARLLRRRVRHAEPIAALREGDAQKLDVGDQH